MNYSLRDNIIDLIKEHNIIINNNDEIQMYKTFCLLFNNVPNVYSVNMSYDDKKLVKFLNEKYNDSYYTYLSEFSDDIAPNVDRIEKNEKYQIHMWIIYEPGNCVIVSCEAGHIKIYHDNENDDWCETFIEQIRNNCYVDKKPNKFNIIVKEGMYLNLKQVEPISMNVDINLMYNDDFNPIHNKIVSFLQNDDSGIIILHGKQGTGKTSYIRHLISNNIDKKIIYVTPDMMNCLSSPDIIPFMIENKDSILILEDCEELLRSRKGKDTVNSGLINILNMSDGLLGDILHVKFICTFNEDMSNIDIALQRKGRLVAKYEFKSLDKSKVKILNEKYNLEIPNVNINDMTLAEAFNFNDVDYTKVNYKIGLI